ncbi:hypothetical protein N7493_005619 [Penicillium malachiteum]|uniref:Uncharacterized protein n=1 Tax=Penicillium malachiteum TaxID=1324776 RepID=A0AAD6MWQ6_9EURO|nr:hypothetical protein N7493_005619 [Penicillium malachiteum]
MLRSFINRHRHDNEEDNEQPPETKEDSFKNQRDNVPQPPRRDTPCSNDTNSIVNQLAVLAASIRGISSNDTASINSSSSTTSTYCQAEDRIKKPQDFKLEGNESFDYLRSLITVSCGPQTAPDPSPSSKEIPPTPKIPPLRRKRASSRLSLRLSDIPNLPFTPKTLRKPYSRYTTLPPVYAHKPNPIRPEICFRE